MSQIIDTRHLTDFAAEVLGAVGVPEQDARLVSDSLVTADLAGHPSHGLLRLPWYVARLRSGAMHAETRTEIVTDRGALAVVDGHDGVGQVITARACDLAVARAREYGVATVAVRASNHFGTAAYWTRRMAERGCIGILTTNGSPAMAPWGGTQKTVGANPWSIAAPAGSHPPAVLDIANTGVARGKIYAAAQRGESIPEGWALDEKGVPTTDPDVAVHGLLAPMGGHKGFGIAFMMDVLSGVLTGSGYATDVVGPYVADRRSGCGHLVLAIDIGAIMALEDFGARMDDLIGTTKSVPLAEGTEEIHYPGEIEARAERRHRPTGVTLPDKTVDELRNLATSWGLALPRTREAD